MISTVGTMSTGVGQCNWVGPYPLGGKGFSMSNAVVSNLSSCPNSSQIVTKGALAS